MKYQIEIHYDSYDSFNRYDNQRDCLDGTWENVDVIKRNLQRIKEHYIYSECKYKAWKYKEFAQISYDIDNKDWPVKYTYRANKETVIAENALMLELDNGKMYQVQAFWIGWGSSFHGAKAVIWNDPELEVTV